MYLGLRLVAVLGVLLLLSSFSSSHAISRPKNIDFQSYDIYRGRFLTKHAILEQRDNVVRTIATENVPIGTTKSPGLKLPRTPAAPRIIRPKPGLKAGGKSSKVVNNPAAGRTGICRRAEESCPLLEKYREKYALADDEDKYLPSIYDKYMDSRVAAHRWTHKILVIKESPEIEVCRFAIRDNIYITKFADTRDFGFEQLKYSDIMYFNMKDETYLPYLKTLATDIILEPRTKGAIERAFRSRGLDIQKENDVTFSYNGAGWNELTDDNPFIQANQRLIEDRAEELSNPWIDSVDVYSRPNLEKPEEPILYMVSNLASVTPRDDI